MRKTERLDQVLLRLGYATQSQIEEAVERQKTHGGRFGTNLVKLGVVTEEQLFDALVEQFRVPTVSIDESSVKQALLERMPPDILAAGTVMPVAWNNEQKVLSLAVANPSDEETIQAVGMAFGARKVRVSIAPETVLASLAKRLRGEPVDDSDGSPTLVAFPELFEPEDEVESPPEEEPGDESRLVLMVTPGASRKNFLPPVFKSEGIGLTVVTGEEDVENLPEGASFERTLVAPGLEKKVRAWVDAGLFPGPIGELTGFPSVSEALLENPAPYGSVVSSLRGTVQTMAEFRSAQHGVSAPYALMTNDLEVMTRRLGLRRLVADGLHVGLHLLMPAAEVKIDPFSAFTASLELATRIRFPWPVDTMLAMCQGLYVGRVELEKVEDPENEIAVAAQLLALVWYRHNLVRIEAESDEEAMTELRTSLREAAGRLASLGVIESYLDAVAERGGVAAGDERTVLMVGGERLERVLAPALVRVGCDQSLVGDIGAAQAALEEHQPSAVVIDHAEHGGGVAPFAQIVKLGGETLFFVVTDSEDPALVLNLLDIGVDDVFGPPHDFDLVAARVNRALLSRSIRSATPEAAPGEFSAKFEAFSFLDLAQMLSNGMKSVRVDLTGPDEERAVLFLLNGTPVFAACGDLTGPQAVYQVITWEEQGEFTVREAHDPPGQNIQESTESLLMEGVRLLDESRA